MTREDIVRLWDEANNWGIPIQSGLVEELERFAALAIAAERERIADEAKHIIKRAEARGAAAERERIFAANAPVIEQVNTHIKALVELVAAEREACAKVCETRLSKLEHTDKPYNNGVRACAAAIRARGEE